MDEKENNQKIPVAEEKKDCPGCSKLVTADESDVMGFCTACDDLGLWMDPAGGVHAPGEEDPAKMYE